MDKGTIENNMPLIFKVEVNKPNTDFNSDEYESFLFNIDTEEINKILDKNIDEILYQDFKQKLSEEEFKEFEFEFDEDLEDLDEDLDENDIEFDESNIKSIEIPLEQAVIDFIAGISDAYDYIYSHYKPILDRWGRRCNNDELGCELLDIVLLNAVNTFDNTAGTKFNTYFWTCAKNYINCNTVKNNAKKRAHNKNMVSLQKKYYNSNSDSSEVELEKMVEDESSSDDHKQKELIMSIQSMNDCLKESEITMLLRLIDNFTLQEIGDELGITAAAVCMALKRISKKSIAAKKLKDILINK